MSSGEELQRIIDSATEMQRLMDRQFLTGSTWTDIAPSMENTIKPDCPNIKVDDLQEGWHLVDGSLFRISL